MCLLENCENVMKNLSESNLDYDLPLDLAPSGLAFALFS